MQLELGWFFDCPDNIIKEILTSSINKIILTDKFYDKISANLPKHNIINKANNFVTINILGD
ncbi:putative F-box and FNIP repeat-containing protein [Megavirus courdo7]|uniref:Putative F-box and FNIP repeat-containing protein n=1 Tax=Megavirus courdo7 TaxID=1128135 RepID=H2ECB9_9VIRU|nr:putative F-box and FNIP repeat-containing protein [Megavirus courdo7]